MPPEDAPDPAAAYDELAATYATDVRTDPYRTALEMPATTALLPEVEGRRVLDAGCGTGLYTEWLVEQGATVVGIDASEMMLSRAVDRVGDRAAFRQTDLSEPLDFPADAFDGIVSALALSYVQDWEAVFAEFGRILKPGGFLVFSTGHPFNQFPPETDEGGNYFAIEQLSKDWDVEVPYYRRPLAAIVNPLLAHGFRLDRLVEPQPTAEFQQQAPERYEKESRFPVFLCVRATNA